MKRIEIAAYILASLASSSVYVEKNPHVMADRALELADALLEADKEPKKKVKEETPAE